MSAGGISGVSLFVRVSMKRLNGTISLASDTDYVQGRLAEYLKDLLSLGVTGLRLDASKRK
jgi:hypothetical protein